MVLFIFLMSDSASLLKKYHTSFKKVDEFLGQIAYIMDPQEIDKNNAQIVVFTSFKHKERWRGNHLNKKIRLEQISSVQSDMEEDSEDGSLILDELREHHIDLTFAKLKEIIEEYFI
eukprot:NODE_367_length_8687_cov_0.577084.p7 type:complete len:117 gc:universal NODE_367_length_8687_cov_0.577084:758-1108(+)